MLTVALVLLVFFFTTGLVYGIALRRANLRRLQGRLASLDVPRTAEAESSHAAPTIRPDLLPTVTRVLGGVWEKRLRLEIVRAGLRLRPAEFVALTLISTVSLAVTGLVMTGQEIMAVCLGLGGLALPVLLLRHFQERRKRLFTAQLVDALTLLVSALRAGYSFLRAVQMVAEEMPPPISEEFAWVSGEAGLGLPLETALERMVARIQSYDLDLMVTAVTIQLQVGGNLAEILNTISETLRERVRMQAEVGALTAEGRLSGIILFLLPLALALLLDLRSPDYFRPLLTTPLGISLLLGAFVSQVIGGLIIRRMVALDA